LGIFAASRRMIEPSEKTWFGQPRGLTILFLTEMWEFFSYYGMRTLLVYYMTKHLLFAQEKSSFIYGSYTATAYLMPIFGGIVADRWLGKRKAVIAGGSIMAIGHFMMAFESLFYPALGAIAVGNGLFLPSLPSQINDLYAAGDPRRGRAYNIYYAGINLGGMLAPLICGTLGEVYGWHYGFGAAGVGMLIGLVIYLAGGAYLPKQTMKPSRTQKTPERSADDPRLVLLLLSVAVAATIFRGAYEQIGNTIPLWTDVGVNRALGRFEIPMTWFQALNPLLVITLTPALLFYWRSRARVKGEIPSARKMAIGAMVVAGAYLLLAVVSTLAGSTHTHWIWLVLFFVVLTIGELYILPTGLGLFARLAPPRLGATTVASWFLTIFSGSLLAGVVGTLWSQINHQLFFAVLAGLALFAGFCLRLLEDPIRKLRDSAGEKRQFSD
jgi:proton-dependent oligopeptide transporter, POT family